MKKYDLAVIGGGPGGYSAAIRATQLGLRTCLFEPGDPGGTCLSRGCIPTKSLYRSAEVYMEAKSASAYGVECGDVYLDYGNVLKRKDDIVSNLVLGISQLLSTGKIDLKAEKTTVPRAMKQADIVIIATGAKSVKPEVTGINLSGVVDSEGLLSMKERPDRLAIIGGGVIGIEFAGIFAAFGTEVTVLEFLPDILPPIDREIRKRLIPMLKKQGIAIKTNCKVREIIRDDNIVNSPLTVKAVTPKDDVCFEADTVLSATGRVPDIDSLDLDNAGIEYDSGCIRRDGNQETSAPGVYVIGDAAGGIMLAHAAAEEGIRVAEHIAGTVPCRKAPKVIPGCIFSFPEIAYAGITEQEAVETGIDYRIGKFMFGANGKALCLGETRGLVKVITDIKGLLLGVHILGPHASDLIHEGASSIENGLSAEELIQVVHAHPTLAEAFHEAVLDSEGRAIHKVK